MEIKEIKVAGIVVRCEISADDQVSLVAHAQNCSLVNAAVKGCDIEMETTGRDLLQLDREEARISARGLLSRASDCKDKRERMALKAWAMKALREPRNA